jgi:DNA-binding NarL/FixJ family response regulator
MARRRVLIADDHPGVLEAVARLLAADYDVVAAVSDGAAAVEAADRLKPDVVVLDISMPNLTGLQAAARISAADSPPRIVFLTVHEDPAFVQAARSAGGSGYVLKSAIAAALLPTIGTVLGGQTVFPAASPEPPARSINSR